MNRYNNVRLQSAISYLIPKDVLASRQVEIYTGATASWKPPDSHVKVATNKLREERKSEAASRRNVG